MANPFVEKEVKKIITEQNIEYPKNMALASAWIIANFKGENIKIFDVKDSSSLCDYNIIATAQNPTQARAIVDEITFNLKRNGMHLISLEGLTDGEWILLDLGDIIVHIFQEYARDIFDLDDLWKHFGQVQIPQDYYFEHKEVTATNTEDSNDNFF